MSKQKLVSLLALVLSLGGLCLYLNRDWFAERPIRISHRISPWMNKLRGRRASPAYAFNPVVFSFDQYYKFKEIIVVSADDIATNKYAHPLWRLVSQTNSYPTATFAYGERIRGMSPEVKRSTAEPLEPGVTYWLIVKTTGQEAQHEFTTTAKN